MGLFPYLTEKSIENIDKKKYIVQKYKEINSYQLFDRPKYISTPLSFYFEFYYNKFEKKIISALMKLNKIFIKILAPKTNVINENELKLSNVENRVEKSLVLFPSSISWSKNCTAFNSTCLGFALSFFNLQIFTFEECLEKKNKFDFIGVFMTLDHIKNPLDTINKLFEITNNIYFEFHTNYSYQHPFSFDENFGNFLMSKGIKVKEISQIKLNSPHNSKSILISKI